MYCQAIWWRQVLTGEVFDIRVAELVLTSEGLVRQF